MIGKGEGGVGLGLFLEDKDVRKGIARGFLFLPPNEYAYLDA